MSHTFTNSLFHVIFSTKERIAYVDERDRSDLHEYIGGIVREIGGKALIVNGTQDHVHVLALVPATLSIADFVRTVKANSSRWMRRRVRLFSWQAGYAAFSVSESVRESVYQYITNQEEHHRKISFQQEFVAYLKAHGIEYDERYIWA